MKKQSNPTPWHIAAQVEAAERHVSVDATTEAGKPAREAAEHREAMAHIDALAAAQRADVPPGTNVTLVPGTNLIRTPTGHEVTAALVAAQPSFPGRVSGHVDAVHRLVTAVAAASWKR